MGVVRSLAVPHEPHGIEAVDLLRAALVMSNESGTVTVLDAIAPRGAPRAARASRARATRRRTRAAASRTSVTTSRARSSPSTCRGRARDRPRRGGGGRAPHLDLAGRHPRRHLARLARRRGSRSSMSRRPQRPRLLRTFPARDLAHDVGFTPDGEQHLDQLGRRPPPRRARRAHAASRRVAAGRRRAAARHLRPAREARLRRQWRERHAADLSARRRQAAAHEPRDERLLQRLRARAAA